MRTRLLLFALILSVLLPLSGEEFHYSSDGLAVLLGEASREPYSFYKDSPVSGSFSLLELLPLMEEVRSLRILSAGGESVWTGEELGEEWGEALLSPSPGGPVFSFRGRDYPGLKELSFTGDRLEAEGLEIWLSWEGVEELKGEIGRFARHHGFPVKTLEVPSPDTKLISVVRARGPLPDLVMIQSSAVERLTETRGIQNLDYLEFPGLIDQGRQAFRLNGRFWGMPFYFDTQVVFYNRNLLSPPDPDRWTLASMEAAARTLKARGVHPLVWNAYSSNWLIPFQMAFGKEHLVEPDGRIIVNDAPTLRALEYILDLQNQGLLVPMERDAMDALFISGKVGMILSGSYAIPYFQSLGLNFGILPFPTDTASGRQVSSLLDFKAFCMTRQTRNPLLARRMLQHLYGRGVQQRFTAALNKLPVRSDLRSSSGDPGPSSGPSGLAAGEFGPVLDRTIDSGTVIPPDGVYGVYKNHMWKLIRFALSGQMSPRDVLVQGQRLMDGNE